MHAVNERSIMSRRVTRLTTSMLMLQKEESALSHSNPSFATFSSRQQILHNIRSIAAKFDALNQNHSFITLGWASSSTSDPTSDSICWYVKFATTNAKHKKWASSLSTSERYRRYEQILLQLFYLIWSHKKCLRFFFVHLFKQTSMKNFDIEREDKKKEKRLFPQAKLTSITTDRIFDSLRKKETNCMSKKRKRNLFFLVFVSPERDNLCFGSIVTEFDSFFLLFSFSLFGWIQSS